MDTLPVTLIVKAPNQQFEDQTIKCEPTWSIRKLKGYLSEVYPCNPTLEEQKLIYSGQLLNDAHILKDVLRKYEGQDTHTVHLVYTPKNRPIVPPPTKAQYVSKDGSEERDRLMRQSRLPVQQPESAFTSEGLRHRGSGQESNANTSAAASSQNTTFMNGFFNTSQPFLPVTTLNQPNVGQSQTEYTREQQIAMQNMMHQMYLQYMNQYAASMQQFNSVSNLQPTFAQPSDIRSSNVEQRPAPPQIQREAAVQPPRNPVAGDDEAENRDWLEILYTLSRLLVLLSLVYFYSSPVRCMIVILAFVLYYVYQSHQRNLRDRQQFERLQEAAAAGEPDDISLENVQEPNTEENEQRNEGPSAQSNSDTANTTSLASGADEQEENHRLPTITLLRTFILSFFSSLIPETPAV